MKKINPRGKGIVWQSRFRRTRKESDVQQNKKKLRSNCRSFITTRQSWRLFRAEMFGIFYIGYPDWAVWRKNVANSPCLFRLINFYLKISSSQYLERVLIFHFNFFEMVSWNLIWLKEKQLEKVASRRLSGGLWIIKYQELLPQDIFCLFHSNEQEKKVVLKQKD